MNSYFKRNWYHILRFRSVTLSGSALMTSLFLLASAFFPGDDITNEMIKAFRDTGLDTIYGLSDIEAYGWLFWLVLQLNVYLYYVPVITGVLIGSRVIPTKASDGLELLLASSPKNQKAFILENFFSGGQALLFVILPGFFVISGFTWYFTSFDLVDRILITFIMSYLVSLTLMSLVAMITTITFSSSVGKKFGFGYLIFGFFFEIGISSSEELEHYGNISLNHYVNPTNSLFNDSFPISKTLNLLVIIAASVFICVLWVNRHDFIEKQSSPSNGKGGSLRFHPTSKLGKRYPFVAEQLRRDFKFFASNVFLVAFFLLYLIVIYPGDVEVAEMLGAFQSPILDAFLFNHSIQYTYTGFIVIEFYAYFYMYFGIFVTFVAASIPTKEVREDYQDVIWANSFKPDKLINSRTFTMLIEITALFWLSYIILNIFEFLFSVSSSVDHFAVFSVFFLNWILYMAYALLIVSITMSFQLSESRKYAIWIYFVFILIILTAFLSGFEMLRFLSYFGYIDNTGILYGQVQILYEIFSVVILTLLSYLMYNYVLKNIYWNKDQR